MEFPADFCFWDSFGHFLVTFSDASVTFFVTFLQVCPGTEPEPETGTFFLPMATAHATQQ